MPDISLNAVIELNARPDRVTVGDIDRDGRMELIAARADPAGGVAELSVFGLAGGRRLHMSFAEARQALADAPPPLQVFDCAGRGAPEAVFAAAGRLYSLDGDGALSGGLSLPTDVRWSAVLPANFTGAGRSDYLMTDSAGRLQAFDHDLNPLWRRDAPIGTPPLVLDANLDGYDEVMTGDALLGRNGDVLWSTGGGACGAVWAGYFTLDPLGGLQYLLCRGGGLELLDHAGHTLWKNASFGTHGIVAAPGRFLDQNTFSVAVVSYPPGGGTGRLSICDMAGRRLCEREIPVGRTPTVEAVRNFDGTGNEYAMVCDRSGEAAAVLYNGRCEAAWRIPEPGPCLHADLTGCGTEDLIVCAGRRLKLYSSRPKSMERGAPYPLRQSRRLAALSDRSVGMPESSPLRNEGAVPPVNLHRGAGPVVFLMGDSTVCDQPGRPFYGWGQELPEYFRPEVSVSNYALSGRAAKSFLWEGHYAEMRKRWRSGDYVLMQFGHNDQKPENDSYSEAFGAYSQLLRFFVSEALAAGLHPAVLSSVERRGFGADGRIVRSHGDYPAACEKVAAELGVPYIDLSTATKELYESYGPERSKDLFVHEGPGVLPAFPDGIADNTHFRYRGAKEIAGIVCREIRGKIPALAEFLLI